MYAYLKEEQQTSKSITPIFICEVKNVWKKKFDAYKAPGLDLVTGINHSILQ